MRNRRAQCGFLLNLVSVETAARSSRAFQIPQADFSFNLFPSRIFNINWGPESKTPQNANDLKPLSFLIGLLCMSSFSIHTTRFFSSFLVFSHYSFSHTLLMQTICFGPLTAHASGFYRAVTLRTLHRPFIIPRVQSKKKKKRAPIYTPSENEDARDRRLLPKVQNKAWYNDTPKLAAVRHSFSP